MGMSYEDKMRMLQHVKPSKKDELLTRIVKGETVDITKDADLFFQVNKDRVSMDEWMQRSKFNQEAENMKAKKQHLHDSRYGVTKDKKMRYLGDIPAEIYFSRKEFAPDIPKEDRDRNIRKFLNTYTAFRAGDKQV